MPGNGRGDVAQDRLSRKTLAVLAGVLVSSITFVAFIVVSPVSAAPNRGGPPRPTPTPTKTTPTPDPTTSAPSGGTVSGVPAGISPGSGYFAKFADLSASAQAAQVALMKADGVKYVRIDVTCDIPNESLIRQVERAGMQVDALLDGPCGGQSASAYATFGTEAVAALEPLGVQIYEVMNEPNCAGISASSYTAILKATYNALVKADSSAFVLAAGLCPNSGSYEPYTYLQAMYTAGAKGYFDAANLHPYSYPLTPLQTNYSSNPWSYLPEMHTIMVNNGDGSKQIWLTEFGCPTGTAAGLEAWCTDTTEGQQITDAFSLARGWSWVGPLFIFSWQDDNADGDFGLYTSSGVAKVPTLADYEAAAGV
jgi:hypothetical protein